MCPPLAANTAFAIVEATEKATTQAECLVRFRAVLRARGCVGGSSVTFRVSIARVANRLRARSAADLGAERLELVWSGKDDARRAAGEPAIGSLQPLESLQSSRRASRNDSSAVLAGGENLVVEGDSFEVLKLLAPTLGARVKLAYIDPPYNTGNDGIYEDDFGGHSQWLGLIYPRLLLLRPLLRADGVVFVSIDESELGRLLVLMDEIFGDENREGVICWRRRYNQPNDKTKMIAKVAEFVVAYARDGRALRASGVGKVDLTGTFANPDADARGDWASKPWKVGSDQSGSRYALTTPAGVTYEETWMGDEETYRALLADDRIVFPNGGRGSPRKKYFRKEREAEGQCATNWWPHESFGHNQGANARLTSLFGVKNVFSNPKPLELLRGLLQIANVKGDDVVLDFFAGSGTTGHAVMEANAADGAARRFVLVQKNERVPEGAPAHALGLRTIPEILRERLRRAGDGLRGKLGERADFKPLVHVP
jgi:adenine-specific DNA-methyltransferase